MLGKTREDLKAVVIERISDIAIVEVESISEESSLTDSFGLDSLDIVELSMGLEVDLHIHIDDDNMDKFTTVKSVIDFLDTHYNSESISGYRSSDHKRA